MRVCQGRFQGGMLVFLEGMARVRIGNEMSKCKKNTRGAVVDAKKGWRERAKNECERMNVGIRNEFRWVKRSPWCKVWDTGVKTYTKLVNEVIWRVRQKGRYQRER